MNDLVERAPRPVGPYVSDETEHALRLWVSGECDTRTEAAIQAGMNPQAFSHALRKPHVLARMEQLYQEQLKVDRVNGRHTIRRLSQDARSEYVKLEAAKHMDAPEQKNQGFLGAVVRVEIDLGVGHEAPPPLIEQVVPEEGEG